MKTVTVKYCGHCNPHLQGPVILEQVKGKLPHVRFISGASEEGAGVLLVISGCPVDCAARPSGFSSVIATAGYTVDGRNVSKDTLVAEISSKLQGLLEDS